MTRRLRVRSGAAQLRTRYGHGADGGDGQSIYGLDAAEGDEQHGWKQYGQLAIWSAVSTIISGELLLFTDVSEFEVER